MKTKQQLLLDFKKMNKVAKLKRALKNGYSDVASYMAFLSAPIVETGSGALPLPSKKEKKLPTTSAILVIHVVDILDASGSMNGEKLNAAIKGINKGIAELNDTRVKYTYTLCEFSNNSNFPHVMVDPITVPKINLRARSMTALYDAIGFTIDKIKKSVKEGEKVLVNIYTDGQENASHRFNAYQIENLITAQSRIGYTFTFIGTQRDVDYMKQRLSIHASNTLVYDGTGKDLDKSFVANSTARMAYTNSVVKGEDVSKGFYKNINKK